jgi:hypothetical protein
MKNNFFNNLGIASVERIHSQMIAWIFNEGFLSNKKKSLILNSLFGLNKDYKDFQALTEYKNIDILIKADNDVFIFENKIKIGQHDNQLENYRDVINKDEMFCTYEPEFAYLSLIGDDSYLSGWKSIKYQDLLLAFKKVKFKNSSEFNKLAFNEYICCLEDLVDVFNKFNNNHQDFLNVFTDGSKKKWEKIKFIKEGFYYKNEDQIYIANNQLETTLQRYFLFKIFKNLKIDSKLSWHVSESRGNALLHIDVILDRYDNKFGFGLQFQEQTFKVVYAKKDYQHSSKNELDENIKKVFLNASELFKFKYNPPKDKAYISISEKYKDVFLFANDFLYLADNFYQKNIENGFKIIKYIIKEYIKLRDEKNK